MQEQKSSGGVVYSVQSTLPEAGGQVGEVPVAVSWVCGLGPLVAASTVESDSPLPSLRRLRLLSTAQR